MKRLRHDAWLASLGPVEHDLITRHVGAMRERTGTNHADYLRGWEVWLRARDIPLLEVREHHISGWASGMLDDGATASTVRTKLSALRALYERALREHLVTEDPTRWVHSPRPPRRADRYWLHRDDLRALLAAADSHAHPSVRAAIYLWSLSRRRKPRPRRVRVTPEREAAWKSLYQRTVDAGHEPTGEWGYGPTETVWFRTASGSTVSFGRTLDQEVASLVRGSHFTRWPDIIRQLKREGRNEEALVLLYECIDAAERSKDGREPAPWYTEQAAIIHRKNKDHSAEIAVLERYVAACPPGRGGGKIAERLIKARELEPRP